ncbi:MAG: prephenate dehydratase domain-containing protein [Actinomycetota bacterium]|nr:prephenate dehydratase domain-containing protein [Actinomycetota bacterium]
MTIGYQGEAHSYSHLASGELFPGAERIGFASFVAAFDALENGEVECLVMPIENSTTGSVLPVLDRLVGNGVRIVAEHLVEVRHALLAHPSATLETIEQVHSHPEALSQAQGFLVHHGLEPMPEHDTAGAVRLVAERGDPRQAVLARPAAGEAHGLVVLKHDVIDRDHNTTRFVVLERGKALVVPDGDKTSIVFETRHEPGALALALTELGLRGANLTRIESRPSETAWNYRMFVDLRHAPGSDGFTSVFEPPLANLASFLHLGTYKAATPAD